MQTRNINNIIDVLGQVKDLKRSGWIKRNVSNPESNGDHMFATAFLVLCLADSQKVDKLHCLELALTHDLAEIISGDPVPGEKTTDTKHKEELAAITQISQKLNMPQLIDWFLEFDAEQTAEAQFVRSLDKLETVLTAAYYDRNNRSESKLWHEFSSYAECCLKRMNTNFSHSAADIIKEVE